MNVGAVGCLRQVRNAAGVAHAVMKYTKHTFLVGSLGTCIAYDYKWKKTLQPLLHSYYKQLNKIV